MVWNETLIQDWNLDVEDMLIKAGGVGKLTKGYCHLWKSIKVGSISLHVGIASKWTGAFLVKGICRYAQVYNVDTNIYGKNSCVLYMKKENGLADDELYKLGPKITNTTSKCSNIMGSRYLIFCCYII